jgi:AcrR family transcriptional regulator
MVVRNDPLDKVNRSHVSLTPPVGNSPVSPGSLPDLMAAIAPHVGARRAATQARSQAKMTLVLQATAQLLDEFGPEAVNTSAVAAKAGVSIGWLYNFFDDREALLEEILVAGLQNLDQQLDAAGFSLAGPGWRATAEAGVDAVIDFFGGLPGFRSLWFSAEFSGRMIQANRLHDDALADYLAASVTHVRPDAPDVSLGVVAKIFVGMLDKGVDLSFRDNPKGDPDLLAEVKRASIDYLSTYLI